MWTIIIAKKTVKQILELPPLVKQQFDLLAKELEVAGPLRANWTNFSKLHGSKKRLCYHCHIKSGKPTYVVCWEISDKKGKIIEVYYAGTHEKAPY